MNAIKQTGLLMSFAALSAAPALAQAPVKLIAAGDTGWSGLADTVTGVFNMDVNNFGQWLAYADGGSDEFNDRAILRNGALFFQENTNTNFPASHTMVGVNDWVSGGSYDSMDINDNADILVLLKDCHDVSGLLPDADLAIWVDGSTNTSHVLLQELLTPTDTMIVPVGSGLDEMPGAVWASFSEIWQNNSDQMVVIGRTTSDSDDIVVFIEHDGAGTITSQTLIASDGAQHDIDFGGDGMHLTATDGFYSTKKYNSLNDAGQFMYGIDDANSGGDTNLDSHIYLYSHATGTQTELVSEGDLSPTGSGSPYNNTSTFEIDINNSGSWVMGCDDDGPSTSDYFLQLVDPMGMSTIILQEGSLAPDSPGVNGWNVAGNGFGNCQISNTGDLTYHIDWNDPDTTMDTGLFQNGVLLVQEGVTMVGLEVVTAVSNSSDGMAVSDSGRFIVINLTVGGNAGAYLIDMVGGFSSFCNGDGGDQMGCTSCPCGNDSVPGTVGGCLNSASTAAELIGAGVPSIVTDTLSFNLNGAPPGSFCILNSGDAIAPGNMASPCFGLNSGAQAAAFDGLRCAITNTLRHGGRAADANGTVGVTNNGWGPPNGPIIGFAAQSGFVAGQTRHFQVINRDDPLTVCMRGLNTSQAVTITYQP